MLRSRFLLDLVNRYERGEFFVSKRLQLRKKRKNGIIFTLDVSDIKFKFQASSNEFLPLLADSNLIFYILRVKRIFISRKKALLKIKHLKEIC